MASQAYNTSTRVFKKQRCTPMDFFGPMSFYRLLYVAVYFYKKSFTSRVFMNHLYFSSIASSDSIVESRFDVVWNVDVGTDDVIDRPQTKATKSSVLSRLSNSHLWLIFLSIKKINTKKLVKICGLNLSNLDVGQLTLPQGNHLKPTILRILEYFHMVVFVRYFMAINVSKQKTVWLTRVSKFTVNLFTG